MSLSGMACPTCKGKLVAEPITSSGFTSGLKVTCGVHGEVTRVAINTNGKTETLSQILARISESLRVPVRT